jgi:hypothetical protein
MRTKLVVAASLSVLALGCENDSSKTVDNRVDLPPAPEHGRQFVLPDAIVQPGEEKMYCWYITLPDDEDVYVGEYQAYQGEGGHHVVGFITMEDEPDGTIVDCESPESMAMWLPLLTPTSEGHFQLPSGYGVRIPGASKLVFQSHYVNAGDAPIRVADVVNLYYVDDALIPTITPAAPWGNTVLDFQIAAGETKTVEYECTAPSEMKLITLLGHMHEFGKAITISAGPSGGTMETLYEVMEWKPEFRDKSPLREWTVEDPYVMAAGNVMRVSCTWTNDSPDALQFPKEMCASLSWFYPGNEPLTCAGNPL